MPPIVHIFLYGLCACAGWFLRRRAHRLQTDPRLRRTWDELQGLGNSYDALEVRVRAIHEHLDGLDQGERDFDSRQEFHLQRANQLEFERVSLQTSLAESDARARRAEGVNVELEQAVEAFLGSFRSEEPEPLALGLVGRLESLGGDLATRLGREEHTVAEMLGQSGEHESLTFLGAALDDGSEDLGGDPQVAERQAELENELGYSRVTIDALSAELCSKEARIDGLLQRVRELESNHAATELAAELEDLRSERQQMEAEEKALRRRLADAETTLSETTIRALDSELSATARQHDDRAHTAEALAETRHALEAAELERSIHAQQVELLSARIAELDATLEGVAQREEACHALEQRFAELEAQREQALSRARKLRSRLGEVRVLREELAERVESCEALDERVLALEASRKRATAKNRVLRRELEDAREDLRRAGLDPEAWQAERAQRLADMEDCMEAVRQLASDLDLDERRHQRSMTEYEKELSEREDEVVSLSQLLSGVNDMCSTADELVRSIERK